MPDARRTRSLACEKQKAHERSHRELAETIRHSPRDGFTVSFALAPETGLSCLRPPRDAKHHREVDISVGISGPHDFAVRRIVTRQLTLQASIASRVQRSGRCATPLLAGAGWGGLLNVICPT